jgi:sodium-dependent multivitamin transporter 6
MGFSGLAIFTIYHKCDPLFTHKISTPNQYLTYFIENHFSSIPGMVGLFLGAVFCSSLSSLSSAQNSSAAIVWRDFMLLFSYFRNLSDKESLTVNKLIVLASGVLCGIFTYIISFSSKNLLQISITLNGSFNAPLLGLFCLSLFFSCTNKYGAIAGMLAGQLMTFWVSLGAMAVEPVYPRLPVSIESCFNETLYPNLYSPVITFDSQVTNYTGINKFYSLSYNWYTAFGTIITIVVGLFVSLFTGGQMQSVDQSFILYDLLECFDPIDNEKTLLLDRTIHLEEEISRF